MFVMQKDVYDAIDLVSVAYKGLIAGQMTTVAGGEEIPGCMVGAALFAGAIEGDPQSPYSAARRAVEDGVLPHYDEFDDAHDALTLDCNKRLPWARIAKKMGVVRGK